MSLPALTTVFCDILTEEIRTLCLNEGIRLPRHADDGGKRGEQKYKSKVVKYFSQPKRSAALLFSSRA